jgi:hypothetical protein
MACFNAAILYIHHRMEDVRMTDVGMAALNIRHTYIRHDS